MILRNLRAITEMIEVGLKLSHSIIHLQRRLTMWIKCLIKRPHQKKIFITLNFLPIPDRPFHHNLQSFRLMRPKEKPAMEKDLQLRQANRTPLSILLLDSKEVRWCLNRKVTLASYLRPRIIELLLPAIPIATLPFLRKSLNQAITLSANLHQTTSFKL